MANLSALKAGGVPSTFTGHTSLTAQDGDVAVTGVGFKPNWITVVGLYDFATGCSITLSGYKNSGGRSHSRTTKNSDGFYNSETSSLYAGYNESAAQAQGTLKSFDADGFTIDKGAYAFACEIFWIVGR